MISAPGIYTDIAVSDYFADPCPAPSVTQSLAKILLDRSPLHAWHSHPRLGGGTAATAGDYEEYVPAQAIGNAAHKLLLDRGKDVVIIEAANFRTKQAQETRDAVFAEGKVPILAKHHHRARAMVKVAQDHLAMFGMAKFDGDSEVVIAWEADGLWFRSMIDRLSRSRTLVLDYKTSGLSCAPHALGRMLADAGWDVQAAMHERGLDAIDPDSAGRRRHLFLAQENELPYAATLVEISESVLTIGRKKLQMATDIWRRCLEADLWPAYPAEIARPQYPGWMETAWLEREVVEDAREERLLDELARRKDDGEVDRSTRVVNRMLTDLAGG